MAKREKNLAKKVEFSPYLQCCKHEKVLTETDGKSSDALLNAGKVHKSCLLCWTKKALKFVMHRANGP